MPERCEQIGNEAAAGCENQIGNEAAAGRMNQTGKEVPAGRVEQIGKNLLSGRGAAGRPARSMDMKLGKIPESILCRSVLSQLKTKREEVVNGAGVGEDCAVFSFGGADTASCVCQDSFIQELWEHGSNGGERAFMSRLVTKCVNNLAAAGAQPVALTLGLLLPPDCEEAQLRRLVSAAEEAAKGFHMQIAGGHTSVNPAVTLPCVTAVGYGRAEGYGCMGTPVCPGQDIVVSKWIGMEGTSILARKCREGLLSRYPAFLVEEAVSLEKHLCVLPEAAVALGSGVCAMHDVSGGGIFAALWELAQRAGSGLSVDLRKLPIRQETVEVCEFCGVNPYELLSGGALLMVTGDGPGLEEALKAEGIPAAVVGRITGGRDRIVRNEDEIRYLDKPGTDEIYNIRKFAGKGGVRL